jgi:hypothetical protein
MGYLLNIILNSINTDIIFNIWDINIGLFIVLFTVYYLLPGTLYYIYILYKNPENKEKWNIYLCGLELDFALDWHLQQQF